MAFALIAKGQPKLVVRSPCLADEAVVFASKDEVPSEDGFVRVAENGRKGPSLVVGETLEGHAAL